MLLSASAILQMRCSKQWNAIKVNWLALRVRRCDGRADIWKSKCMRSFTCDVIFLEVLMGCWQHFGSANESYDGCSESSAIKCTFNFFFLNVFQPEGLSPWQIYSAALLAAACKDVTVSSGYPCPARASQTNCLQFGGVWTAAETRAFERLLQDGAERDQRVWAGSVAAVTLTSSQQNHL